MSLVESKNVATNKYELTIKVDADTFKAAIDKVYRKNAKSIQVPGFRKGKAPRAMVEKMYGEAVFFEDAVNDLYPEAVANAVEEAKLEIVARPDVEVTEVSKEEGVTIVATCIVKPEVSVKDYKGIEVERAEEAVTDEMIDNKLASMQQRNARMIDVEGRAAKNGDTVVFDFEGFVDDKAFDGGKAEKFSLTLGSGQFIPGFEEQIEGKEIGEEFDVNVTFPEDYHAEELKGKPAVFKCKLHEIKEKELPALDDEFAKDVSEFDTLEELKNDLKAKEVAAAKQAADDAVENKLVDAVIANMEAEIPEQMYDNRVDSMVQDFDYRLQSQGMNLETYLKYTGMDMDAFRKTFRPQAEKQVQIRLALEKIVELEALDATEEELDAEFAKMAENYKMDVEQIKKYVPAEQLKQDLLVNKAIDLVKNTAVVTEKAADAE
jgi:trigger factor